jgi:hypothetical protein
LFIHLLTLHDARRTLETELSDSSGAKVPQRVELASLFEVGDKARSGRSPSQPLLG